MNTTLFWPNLPQPVMPVITVPSTHAVKPMIDAIVEGGCQVLEITLRTEAGLEAISYASQAHPNVVVGAGSVLNVAHWDAAVKAGSQFLISPGATSALFKKHSEGKIPWLPGVANASDIMQALEQGLEFVKFFPAVTLGGLPAIRNYASVFPQIQFCPTGGVKPADAQYWLAEKSIFAVGGSWFTPKDLVELGQWDALKSHIADFWAGFNV